MSQTIFSVRPARTPEDYVPITAVLEAEAPGWGATVEELAYEDARRDPQCHRAVFVAELEDRTEPLLVGVAFVGHEALAHHEGRFKVATLLKLYSIRYAQAHGNRRLWVTNDSVNVAMLALNEKLALSGPGPCFVL